VAAAAEDPGDKPAGGGVIVPRLIKWGGQVSPSPNPRPQLVRSAWRGAIARHWRNGVGTRLQSNIPRPRMSQLGQTGRWPEASTISVRELALGPCAS
jgi:hypothetical protein